MGVVEGVGQAGHQVHSLGHGEGVIFLLVQVCLEGGTVDEGHDQVVQVSLTPVVQNRHDAGVIEAGGGAGFALESDSEFRVGSEVGVENLDRDIDVGVEIAGPVDLRHRPLAEQLQEVVVAERLANQISHASLPNR